MMLVLVPAMSDIYGEFGGELPTITRVMVAMSDFFINYWWAIVIVLLGLLSGYKVWVDTPKKEREQRIRLL